MKLCKVKKTYEGLVMVIMKLGAAPERDEVTGTPREVVAAVSFDGLEETNNQPDQDGEIVAGQHEGTNDSSDTQDHSLNGVGILCGETERSC